MKERKRKSKRSKPKAAGGGGLYLYSDQNIANNLGLGIKIDPDNSLELPIEVLRDDFQWLKFTEIDNREDMIDFFDTFAPGKTVTISPELYIALLHPDSSHHHGNNDKTETN